MADKASHHAQSVCIGLFAALLELTCKPAVTSLQLQGQKTMEMAHLSSVPVRRKAVQWAVLPGDNSLWNI